MTLTKTSGILLLYHRPIFQKGAANILENIAAFGLYSAFPVYEWNTELGFPKNLTNYRFEIIVLHYSLFGRGHEYEIQTEFYDYLKQSDSSLKIAFFQDEYRFCQKRFEFINAYNINTVYSCLEQQYHHLVYGKYTKASHVLTYIPGYVSSSLPGIARKFSMHSDQRSVDIGYRARRLDYYMGREAQEKHLIGLEFLERCSKNNVPLRLDINVEESGRLYGNDWYRFMANCKGLLGVESGVSIFDLQDEVRAACERLLQQQPSITFEEVFKLVLSPWENNVPLRTISPRHFEAAAFRSCQILFEGNYSGMMKPDVHYIPLKKDFSNFDEVIVKFRDKKICEELTQTAYRDLIESGAYSYKEFTHSFDQHLKNLGLSPGQHLDQKIVSVLMKDERSRRIKHLGEKLRNNLSWDKILQKLNMKAFRP